jgi:hypothetical protein
MTVVGNPSFNDGLSARSSAFNIRADHVSLRTENAALMFVSLLQFPPVSIIPPMLTLIFILTLLLSEGQAGETWEL